MRKNAPLLIAVLALSSLIMVGRTFAQSFTPSVPGFSVKLEAHPYHLSPTYSIDPYTGDNVTIHEGAHVANRSIIITIGNQYVPSSYSLFYNVRVRGHFGGQWTELYPYSADSYSSGDLPAQSNSDYTVLSTSPDFPANSEVDYQVEAMLWHNVEVWIPDHPGISGGGLEKAGHYETRLALYSTSDWSETQTLTIEASQTPSPEPASTPTPTQEPTQTEFTTVIGVAVVAVVIGAGSGLLVFKIRRK